MKRNYARITINSLMIAVIGVYGIDYISHLLFSNPMETIPYFLAKMTLYFVFSFIFLCYIDSPKNIFVRVLLSGIGVALIWGFYYNILPIIMDKFFGIDFYPFGISLIGLSFLGMSLMGTGLAFGTVHTLAFVGGYYISKYILKFFR